MNKDLKIGQKNQFNQIKINDGDIFKNYNVDNKVTIEFHKDILYIIEVKRNSCDLLKKDTLNKILNKKNAFIQLYHNFVFDKMVVEKSNFELLFIYNKNRNEVVKNITKLEIKNGVFFSNPNISLNAISSLNRNVYELNVKNHILKNEWHWFIESW